MIDQSGWAANEVERQPAEQDEGADLQDFRRAIRAHPVPDQQRRRDRRAGEQALARADHAVDERKGDERRKRQQHSHDPNSKA